MFRVAAPPDLAATMPSIKLQLRQLIYEKTAKSGRFDNPITQEEVADAIGVSRATISDWSRGKAKRLDIDIVAKLCQYFDCEVGDLLRLEKDE